MKNESITYTKATEVDEPGLRQILKETPMPGAITLSFEREPYFFKAAELEGENHVTLLSKNKEEKVVSIVSRSSRPYWIDGKIDQLGYISQLRIAKGARGSRGRIIAGCEKMHEIHREFKDTNGYLVSVLEDNIPARKFLTSGHKNIPIHNEIGRLNTFVLPLMKRKINPSNYEIRRGKQGEEKLIIDLLQKNYNTKVFAPYWTEESLFHSNLDISPESFFIVFEKTNLNLPIGCLAVWDQRRFKQVYVQDYESKLKTIRPFLNALRRWTRLPYFPKIGSAFSNAYLSHFALDLKHSSALVPLVQTAINENLNRGFHYFSIGFFEWSEYAKLIKKAFKPFTLNSIVYLAHWPEDKPKIELLPNDDAHIEIAIL